MANAIFSAILQVVVLSTFPAVVYLFKAKKLKGFFEYIGLKKSNRKANLLGLALALVLSCPLLLLVALNAEVRAIMTDPQSVTGAIRQMGTHFTTVIVILATAILKTALAEEIFFRGFLVKRLIAIIGFQWSNAIQAILFGLLHTLLFYGLDVTSNPFFLTLIFVIPALGAWVKVYINEKLADGSIIPGWIAHASANTLTYSMIAFAI